MDIHDTLHYSFKLRNIVTMRINAVWVEVYLNLVYWNLKERFLSTAKNLWVSWLFTAGKRHRVLGLRSLVPPMKWFPGLRSQVPPKVLGLGSHFSDMPMLHSVGNTYRGCFLEDYFYCYSQQVISAVDKESLIPHNLTHRAPET